MNFYSHSSYQSLLTASVAGAPGATLTYQKLAQVAGIQKSYLSKVLHEKAHLNSDQLYAIGDFFGWSAEEISYSQLLLELARTGLPKRKAALAKQIQEIQRAHLDTSAHIAAEAPALSRENLQSFYLDPWLQILHVALSVDSLAAAPEKLVRLLGLEKKALESGLAELVRIGMAEAHGKKLVPKHPQLHLQKTSPVYRSWRNQVRLQTLNRLHGRGKENDYSFSVTFSADEAARTWLRQEFLALLNKAEKKIQAAPTEQVYQMNFDLFSWTGD